MNRKQAKEIINILNTEVADLLKRHGLQIETGNASYSDTSLTFKSLRINKLGSLNKEGESLESHIKDLKTYSKWLLKTRESVHIDKEMKPNKYKLVGYKPRAKKYPYILEDEKGQQWGVKENLAKKYFGYPNKNHADSVPEGTPLNELPIGL